MPRASDSLSGSAFSEEWRIEWIDDDGRIEVAIFAGPKARERAIRYAGRQYGLFEEVSLTCRRRPKSG
jgi:hypothetical protein